MACYVSVHLSSSEIYRYNQGMLIYTVPRKCVCVCVYVCVYVCVCVLCGCSYACEALRSLCMVVDTQDLVLCAMHLRI